MLLIAAYHQALCHIWVEPALKVRGKKVFFTLNATDYIEICNMIGCSLQDVPWYVFLDIFKYIYKHTWPRRRHTCVYTLFTTWENCSVQHSSSALCTSPVISSLSSSLTATGYVGFVINVWYHPKVLPWSHWLTLNVSAIINHPDFIQYKPLDQCIIHFFEWRSRCAYVLS